MWTKRRTPRLARGVDHRRGAADIDRLEAGAVGRVDQAGDVDDRVGAGAQLGQAVGPVERALDPVDPLLGRPPAAGERAELVAGRAGGAEQMAADEAGPAGDRERAVRGGCGS